MYLPYFNHFKKNKPQRPIVKVHFIIMSLNTGYRSHHIKPSAEVMVSPTEELEEVTLALIALPGGTTMLPVNTCVNTPGVN